MLTNHCFRAPWLELERYWKREGHHRPGLEPEGQEKGWQAQKPVGAEKAGKLSAGPKTIFVCPKEL